MKCSTLHLVVLFIVLVLIALCYARCAAPCKAAAVTGGDEMVDITQYFRS